jgi:hypothetical protein
MRRERSCRSIGRPKLTRARMRSRRRTSRRRRRSCGTKIGRWRRWRSGIRCERPHPRRAPGRTHCAGRVRAQVEIKVYKQKVKHLLYEHQNNITSLKIDSETALKMQLVRTTRRPLRPRSAAHPCGGRPSASAEPCARHSTNGRRMLTGMAETGGRCRMTG